MSSTTSSLPYLRIASGGSLVRSIQGHLLSRGLEVGSADGIFGRQTEQAIRSFQKQHSLAGDGIVGPETWRALSDSGLDIASLTVRQMPTRTPPPFFRVGTVGPHVRAIQERLTVSPTQVFDEQTEDAVRVFQRERGLRADGIVGRATWAALLGSGLDALDLPPFGSENPIRVSDHVRQAHDGRRADELTSYDVVAELLHVHPEYADGRAGSFDLGPAPIGARRLFFTEWLARVRPLIDSTRVARLTTRTVVWGLALLDGRLYARLERDDFLTAFRAFRTEEILSPDGRALLRRRTLRPGTAVTSDAWTARDRLESELYADAIARFILSDRTRAPLTIGIKAPWGAGKTSLMRMVRRQLDPAMEPLTGEDDELPAPPRRSDERHLKVWQLLSKMRRRSPEQAARELAPTNPLAGAERTTIWFNAWKYQSSEQLWAGLAHAIVSQLERRMTPLERESFWASLHVRRLHPGAIRHAIYLTLATRLVPWLLVATAGGLAAAAGATGSGAVVAGAAIVGGTARSLGFLREDVAAASPQLVRDPGYEGRLGFLHLVEEDMNRILELAHAMPSRPLVVFVDDLDRCSYGTVAQVIEALNVFLAGDFNSCMFVIAMEPDLVAAQIHVAYEKLFSHMGDEHASDLGWRFLEKMVQLPVALPPPSPSTVGRYVGSILGPGGEQNIELDDDDDEVKEAAAAFRKQTISGAATVGEASRHVRADLARRGPLTARQDVAIRRQGRREFEQRLDESDPEVRRLLLRLAGELPPNPREIKRFINVFRFYAYVQYWREDAQLPAPSLDGVAKLALLAVRYPHLLSALGTEVGQHDERRLLLSWLESARDAAEWKARAQLAPERLRPQVEAAGALRELLTRDPILGADASGFL